MKSSAISRVAGTAVVLRGNDIDTDRIIPARFLKTVTFEGLAANLFADDRAQLKAAGSVHPFDVATSAAAAVLVVNKNFGCGSSREHAPQAIQRWGIRAILGESFSEIFFGNSVALGMPCLTVTPHDAEALLSAVEANPQAEVTVSVGAQTVEVNGTSYPALMPAGSREAFTGGTWDATGLLLDDFDRVKAVAQSLPYVSGF